MTTLDLKDITKIYKVRGSGKLAALDKVSFTLQSGQSIALVGQSGSGKSTLAKIITRLEYPTSGEMLLDDKEIARHGRKLTSYRQTVRMVFQDPFASLNPYHTIKYHIERPLRIDKVVPRNETDDEVVRLLERVQLDPALANRRPHELSGGQRQRVAIARALASRPKLLIADEPVSMLDVSLRLGVLNLLASLQRRENLGILYITHDLATARHFSDEIMVLNHGVVVERGPSDEVILNPQDEYTKRLLSASPNPERHFSDLVQAAKEKGMKEAENQ
jgi:ATPase components of various ABC-type transport systems, contain duplicated ATPase